MKNHNLYINHNGNKQKLNLNPLVDMLLLLSIGVAFITMIICL